MKPRRLWLIGLLVLSSFDCGSTCPPGACPSGGGGASIGGGLSAGTGGGFFSVGGGTAGGQLSTGGGVAPDCLSGCTIKAQSCGAPQAGAAQYCNGWCMRNPTPAQIQCLQTLACSELMTTSPCGVSPVGGGSPGGGSSGGGTGGGRAGGASGGAGGGSVLACAGQSCSSGSACCSRFPHCSPDSSACTVACKPNGQSCFFDSDCCNGGCDRATNTCTSCLGKGSTCGNGATIGCCNASCTNQRCASCGGAYEICTVNADCCAGLYCNVPERRCFRRLADGGVP